MIHEIKITPEFKLKQFKAHRVPKILKGEINRQIDELLKQGLIKPSNSPMARSIICVLKNDKLVRLICDCRYVNKYTVPDGFPMQNIDEVKLKLGKSNFISVFDAKSGYWQIKVREEDQWLTAFGTHDSLYEWTRVPFGMKNSEATLLERHKRFSNQLRVLLSRTLTTWRYIPASGILHLRNMKRYLTAFRDSGLTLKLGKSEFGKNSVKYVGHIIRSGRHEPDPERIQVVVEMPRPITKKQTRQVLGMVGFFRSYIPDFSIIAKPLTDLTRKNEPANVLRTEAHQRAFDELEYRLCRAPCLSTPDVNKPWFLQCDASSVGVGACIGQYDSEGRKSDLSRMQVRN